MRMASRPAADFDDFVVAAWPRLCRAARLLTDNPHEAEDLTQTALARTYAVWRRVRRDDAYAYTRRVLVNVSIDNHRRRKWREVALSDSDDEGAAPDDAATVDQRDQIVRLLSKLGKRERAVLVLRYYFGLSVGEVAGELKTSNGTVKSTASRALAKLRVFQAESMTEERQ
jgi:RNA polymerase sigma-70 factor (sigma-E family)